MVYKKLGLRIFTPLKKSWNPAPVHNTEQHLSQIRQSRQERYKLLYRTLYLEIVYFIAVFCQNYFRILHFNRKEMLTLRS